MSGTSYLIFRFSCCSFVFYQTEERLRFCYGILTLSKLKKHKEGATQYPEQDFSIILGKHIIYTYENDWQYGCYFKSKTKVITGFLVDR